MIWIFLDSQSGDPIEWLSVCMSSLSSGAERLVNFFAGDFESMYFSHLGSYNHSTFLAYRLLRFSNWKGTLNVAFVSKVEYFCLDPQMYIAVTSLMRYFNIFPYKKFDWLKKCMIESFVISNQKWWVHAYIHFWLPFYGLTIALSVI